MEIYNFSMYYVYNGFYIIDLIAHCLATFSALRALLSSRIMTNKDDDNNMFKMITEDNDTAAYVIPQDQCEGNSIMQFISIKYIVYND